MIKILGNANALPFEVYMDNIEYEVTGTEYTSNYKKFEPDNPLNRPDIKYKNFVLSVILFILLLTGVYVITKTCVTKSDTKHRELYPALCTVVAGSIYLCAISKKAVIWCVKVYQHYAPEHVRLRCAFEPSCSEYMILAVKKYGTLKGVAKGINRLLRCHPPGGIDYP